LPEICTTPLTQALVAVDTSKVAPGHGFDLHDKVGRVGFGALGNNKLARFVWTVGNDRTVGSDGDVIGENRTRARNEQARNEHIAMLAAKIAS
jgi:hypothetical protein